MTARPSPPNTERFSFPNGRGQELSARLELPPEGAPHAWALFAHCFTCGKDIRAATTLSRALAAKGFGVLRFDFTGLGGSEGDFANEDFSSNVADLLAAARALEERHGAPALLVGHSLGGAAVLAAAHELPSVKAVATVGAPAEPAHVRRLVPGLDELEADGTAEVNLGGRAFRIGRDFLEDLDRHSLRAGLSELDAAVMILHSPQDTVVSVDNAKQLFEAADHPKSYVSLDGADHLVSRTEDAQYVADVLGAWAARYVGTPSSDPAGASPSSSSKTS